MTKGMLHDKLFFHKLQIHLLNDYNFYLIIWRINACKTEQIKSIKMWLLWNKILNKRDSDSAANDFVVTATIFIMTATISD